MSAVALILAAGEGTRMRSDLPKVAHRVLGVPMVSLVTESAEKAGCEVVVITGHKAEAVESLLSGVTFVRQECQLGTAHAVLCAKDALEGVEGSLVVLSGDTPLISPETIRSMIDLRESSSAAVMVLTAEVDDPSGYGRIVRGSDGTMLGIVEHKDATAEQLAIREVNTGTYCFDVQALFEHLDRVGSENSQGEFYLTDMVSLFHQEGLGVVSAKVEDPQELLGVNSRVQLAEATAWLQARINTQHMLAGVTMTDPSTVWIGPEVRIGRDVVIEPMTTILGATVIEDGCHIGPSSRIEDSEINVAARVDSSVVLSARIGQRATVGPFTYLRPGAVLMDGAKAGAFVEIKNSEVGPDSKVPHLSYIGDATIGRGVNIGAGSITCNYDGERKSKTIIEDGAFVGSDTMLIAPVRIGRGAVTAASSAISSDVPDGALGIERCEQREVPDWAKRCQSRRKGPDDTKE